MSSNSAVEAGVVPADVRAALTALAGVFDVLQAADWAGCGDDGDLAVAGELERQLRRAPSVQHALVVDLEIRSVAARQLVRGTAHQLAERLHLDLPEARARVRAAAELGPRTALGGEPLEPAHPATAAAQVAGAISDKHAHVITRAIGALPRSLDPDVLVAAERTLVGHAEHLCPSELGRAAERLVAHLDPDGSLTSDLDRARRRHLTIGQQGADGMTPLKGLLTPECRALLDAAIIALARPTPEGETRDPRSAGQRNHDALSALCSQLLAEGSLPSNRGLPAEVVIIMTLDQIEAAMATAAADRGDDGAGGATGVVGSGGRAGCGGRASRPARARDSRRRPNPDGATARTSTGVDLPLPDALRIAAQAHPVLAIVDRGGQPLFVGRGTRYATPAQRLALAARDRGCTRPGCPAPPGWCEAHHITEWQDGGPTDITNLALVCSVDHHLITAAGYTVRLGSGGRVEWTAPGHLDPGRRPRTNPLHHPPDLTDVDPPVPARVPLLAAQVRPRGGAGHAPTDLS